jgi:hypothetical protein
MFHTPEPCNIQNVSNIRKTVLLCYLHTLKRKRVGLGLGLLYLTPLSTIFQLYRGGQFLLVEETGVTGENHRSVASH